jgi:predicted HicB family RNase H-like nuclease
MNYKGYAARFEVDTEAGLIHGEVLGIRDVLTFQATSVDELEQAFRDTVDDYLEFCQERGEEPDKPFSGSFLVRLDPEQHRACWVTARKAGKSLNAWVVETITQRTEL